jgi:hypothetical protein
MGEMIIKESPNHRYIIYRKFFTKVYLSTV